MKTTAEIIFLDTFASTLLQIFRVFKVNSGTVLRTPPLAHGEARTRCCVHTANELPKTKRSDSHTLSEVATHGGTLPTAIPLNCVSFLPSFVFLSSNFSVFSHPLTCTMILAALSVASLPFYSFFHHFSLSSLFSVCSCVPFFRVFCVPAYPVIGTLDRLNKASQYSRHNLCRRSSFSHGCSLCAKKFGSFIIFISLYDIIRLADEAHEYTLRVPQVCLAKPPANP